MYTCTVLLMYLYHDLSVVFQPDEREPEIPCERDDEPLEPPSKVVYREPRSILRPATSYPQLATQLNSSNTALFQQPQANFSPQQPIENNTLGHMMTTIPKNTGMSQAYSSHTLSGPACNPATSKTIMNPFAS